MATAATEIRWVNLNSVISRHGQIHCTCISGMKFIFSRRRFCWKAEHSFMPRFASLLRKVCCLVRPGVSRVRGNVGSCGGCFRKLIPVPFYHAHCRQWVSYTWLSLRCSPGPPVWAVIWSQAALWVYQLLWLRSWSSSAVCCFWFRLKGIFLHDTKWDSAARSLAAVSGFDPAA